MPSFLQKLERLAGQWLDTVEEQAQPIVVQIVTGAVFTHPNGSETEPETFQNFQSSVTYQEKRP
jgi:hypothetical protein